MLRSLIEHAIKSIVLYPEQVFITETIEGSKVAIKVHVSKADVGRVIGKNGATIKTLRLMTQALADLKGRKASLEIAK